MHSQPGGSRASGWFVLRRRECRRGRFRRSRRGRRRISGRSVGVKVAVGGAVCRRCHRGRESRRHKGRRRHARGCPRYRTREGRRQGSGRGCARRRLRHSRRSRGATQESARPTKARIARVFHIVEAEGMLARRQASPPDEYVALLACCTLSSTSTLSIQKRTPSSTIRSKR